MSANIKKILHEINNLIQLDIDFLKTELEFAGFKLIHRKQDNPITPKFEHNSKVFSLQVNFKFKDWRLSKGMWSAFNGDLASIEIGKAANDDILFIKSQCSLHYS